MDSLVSRQYTVDAVSNLKDLYWDYGFRKPQSTGDGPRARRATSRRDGRKGPKSLMDLSARIAAENIEDIGLDYLGTIQPALMMRVRQAFRRFRSGPISLHAWKAFNIASQKVTSHSMARSGGGGDGDDGDDVQNLRRFSQAIRNPTADLTTYLKPLQPSGSFAFVSHICIAGACHIRTAELLLLPSLKNLGVLEIIEPIDEAEPFPRVSDRLLRSWSESKDAFPSLLILKIYSRYGLTDRSLQYACRLPVLTLFEIRGRRVDWLRPGWSAAEHGWLACLWATARDLDSLLDSPHRYSTDALSACFQMTQKIGTRLAGAMNPQDWAWRAHASVQTTSSDMLPGGEETWAGRASDPNRTQLPFVSISLGLGQAPIEKAALPRDEAERIFFWRASLFGKFDEPDLGSHMPPQSTVYSFAESTQGTARAYDGESTCEAS